MDKENKKEFYNKLELAMKIGIAVRTLDKLMSDGQISFLKVRGRVIFSHDDVNAFIERTRREAYGINEESLKRYLD
jgi:excisionase family DNA binding protein